MSSCLVVVEADCKRDVMKAIYNNRCPLPLVKRPLPTRLCAECIVKLNNKNVCFPHQFNAILCTKIDNKH